MTSKSAFLFRYVLQSLGLVIVLAILIRIFLISSFVMTGTGMHPAIEPGDFLLGAKWALSAPTRGDVLVLRCPGSSKRVCLKRVVGLSGDRIEFKADQLLLNGDSFLKNVSGPKLPVVVPPHSVFVLNDNHADDEDSRRFGPLDFDVIEARVVGIWLSIDWFYDDGQPRNWPRLRLDRLTLQRPTL